MGQTVVCPREWKKANQTITDERMRCGFERIRNGWTGRGGRGSIYERMFAPLSPPNIPKNKKRRLSRMRIVSQSQDISIPLDRAVLRRDGMTINAELENGKNYLLGAYESEKDAQEEFERVNALIGAGHLNITLGS